MAFHIVIIAGVTTHLAEADSAFGAGPIPVPISRFIRNRYCFAQMNSASALRRAASGSTTCLLSLLMEKVLTDVACVRTEVLLSPANHCCVRHLRPSNVDGGATDMPVYGKRLQFVQRHQANAVCYFRADTGILHQAVLRILVRNCPEPIQLSLVSGDQLSSRNDARRFESQAQPAERRLIGTC